LFDVIAVSATMKEEHMISNLALLPEKQADRKFDQASAL
jgi:hypothetical protein